jgi:hypothetical protein
MWNMVGLFVTSADLYQTVQVFERRLKEVSKAQSPVPHQSFLRPARCDHFFYHSADSKCSLMEKTKLEPNKHAPYESKPLTRPGH